MKTKLFVRLVCLVTAIAFLQTQVVYAGAFVRQAENSTLAAPSKIDEVLKSVDTANLVETISPILLNAYSEKRDGKIGLDVIDQINKAIADSPGKFKPTVVFAQTHLGDFSKTPQLDVLFIHLQFEGADYTLAIRLKQKDIDTAWDEIEKDSKVALERVIQFTEGKDYIVSLNKMAPTENFKAFVDKCAATIAKDPAAKKELAELQKMLRGSKTGVSYKGEKITVLSISMLLLCFLVACGILPESPAGPDIAAVPAGIEQPLTPIATPTEPLPPGVATPTTPVATPTIAIPVDLLEIQSLLGRFKDSRIWTLVGEGTKQYIYAVDNQAMGLLTLVPKEGGYTGNGLLFIDLEKLRKATNANEVDQSAKRVSIPALNYDGALSMSFQPREVAANGICRVLATDKYDLQFTLAVDLKTGEVVGRAMGDVAIDAVNGTLLAPPASEIKMLMEIVVALNVERLKFLGEPADVTQQVNRDETTKKPMYTITSDGKKAIVSVRMWSARMAPPGGVFWDEIYVVDLDQLRSIKKAVPYIDPLTYMKRITLPITQNVQDLGKLVSNDSTYALKVDAIDRAGNQTKVICKTGDGSVFEAVLDANTDTLLSFSPVGKLTAKHLTKIIADLKSQNKFPQPDVVAPSFTRGPELLQFVEDESGIVYFFAHWDMATGYPRPFNLLYRLDRKSNTVKEQGGAGGYARYGAALDLQISRDGKTVYATTAWTDYGGQHYIWRLINSATGEIIDGDHLIRPQYTTKFHPEDGTVEKVPVKIAALRVLPAVPAHLENIRAALARELGKNGIADVNDAQMSKMIELIDKAQLEAGGKKTISIKPEDIKGLEIKGVDQVGLSRILEMVAVMTMGGVRMPTLYGGYPPDLMRLIEDLKKGKDLEKTQKFIVTFRKDAVSALLESLNEVADFDDKGVSKNQARFDEYKERVRGCFVLIGHTREGDLGTRLKGMILGDAADNAMSALEEAMSKDANYKQEIRLVIISALSQTRFPYFLRALTYIVLDSEDDADVRTAARGSISEIVKDSDELERALIDELISHVSDGGYGDKLFNAGKILTQLRINNFEERERIVDELLNNLKDEIKDDISGKSAQFEVSISALRAILSDIAKDKNLKA